MSSTSAPLSSQAGSSAGGSPPQGEAALIALARRANSRVRFLKEALAFIGKEFGGQYAVLYARLQSQVIDEYWHAGATDPSFWKDRVRAHVTDVLKEDHPTFCRLGAGEGDGVALATGLLRGADGASLGVVGVVVQLPRAELAPLIQQRLAARLNLVSCLAGGLGAPKEDASARSAPHLEQLGKLAAYESLRQLAFALTNNLRNKTGCELVALGVARRRRVKVLSISGFDSVNERSPAVAALREAMEECLDADRAIGDQSAGAWSDATGGDHRLHRQWREQIGGGCVASIPLKAADGTTAVLSLSRPAAQPFEEKELEEIVALVSPHVGGFGLVARSGRSLAVHALDAARESAAAVVRPTAWARKAVAAMLVVGALWFCFGTWSFRLPVSATVASAEVRHVAAAAQGILLRVHVTAGDTVRAGEVLCEFDHAELVLERQQLAAELAMYRVEEGKGVADGNHVDAQLAQARQEVLAAQMAILDRRIEQSIVRAPFDGLVASGDLRARVGQMLAMGEPLFEVASNEAWKLELEIPESMSDEVRAGLVGSFVSNARPDEPRALEITRVTPTATPRHGANVYIAEASVEMDQGWVRRGVEGQARLELGARPVWWVALHRVIDYLRMNFWL